MSQLHQFIWPLVYNFVHFSYTFSVSSDVIKNTSGWVIHFHLMIDFLASSVSMSLKEYHRLCHSFGYLVLEITNIVNG